MSCSTALLPKPAKKDDHPIFLRACHSPWVQALSTFRGVIAFYLLGTFIMLMNYDLNRAKHGWLTVFELPNISYLLQVIYAWIVFIWTFMHLYYPHRSSQDQSCTTSFQKLLSPPRTHKATKNRAFFSIFYTAVLVFPQVCSFIYWCVLVPQHETTYPADELFEHGWYRTFYILNKYGVNNAISLIEVIFLSSIRRQTPIWAHTFGLCALSYLYVAWAFIGKAATDKYPYYFFDHEKIGWEYVSSAIIGLGALSSSFFAVLYGITGFREMLTNKCEDRNSGYSRLPQ